MTDIKQILRSSVELTLLRGGLTSMFFFLILLLAFTLFIIFVPLSFLSASLLRDIWNALTIVLGLSTIFGIVLYEIGYRFRRRANSSFLTLGLIAGFIMFGVIMLFKMLGLIPLRLFVNPLILFSSLTVFQFYLFFTRVFRYRSTLLRSFIFVEFSSYLVLMFCSLGIIIHVREIVLFFQSYQSSKLTSLGFYILCIILCGWIFRLTLVLASCGLESSGKTFKGNIAFMVVTMLTIEIYSWILYQSLDFWWLGLCVLTGVLFYVDYRTHIRKFSSLIFVCALLFSLLLTINIFDLETTYVGEYLWPIIHTIVGLLAVVGAFWGVIKERFFKADPKRSVCFSDVKEACQELIGREDSTVTAMFRISRICVISKQFTYCRKLFANKRHSIGLLYHYFRIYLACAQFYHLDCLGKITVDGKTFAKKTEKHFSLYMKNKFFEIKALNAMLWRLFRDNMFITHYIGAENVLKRKPKSYFEKAKTVFKNVVLCLLVLSFLLRDTPAGTFAFLPQIGKSVVFSVKRRLTQGCILFIEAFRPFESDEHRKYYAYLLFSLTKKYKNEKGLIAEDGIVYLSTTEIERLITLDNLILSFYSDKDPFYCDIAFDLGNLYAAVRKHKKAKEFYDISLSETKSLGDRDIRLHRKVLALRKLGDPCDVPSLLKEVEESPTSYPRCRPLLVESYLTKGDYSAAIRLFKIQDETTLSAEEEFLLGEALWQTGETRKALDAFFRSGAKLEEQNLDLQTRSKVLLGLARRYYTLKDYHYSADYLIEYFILQFNRTDVFGMESLHENLSFIRTSISEISKKNPEDPRINLGLFLYFHFKGESDKAIFYLKRHIQGGSTYKRDLIKDILFYRSK